MEARDHNAPWGITRMEPYAETTPVPALTPVIDPETQIAVFIDEFGRTVGFDTPQAGSTSTSTSTNTNTSNSTSTGGSDSYDTDNSYDSDYDSDYNSDYY